jgi:hypothetical protein
MNNISVIPTAGFTIFPNFETGKTSTNGRKDELRREVSHLWNQVAVAQDYVPKNVLDIMADITPYFNNLPTYGQLAYITIVTDMRREIQHGGGHTLSDVKKLLDQLNTLEIGIMNSDIPNVTNDSFSSARERNQLAVLAVNKLRI